MSTKKLQIVGGMNADTIDGKHAIDFATATDMGAAQNSISDLQTKVGDISVSEQISNAIADKQQTPLVGSIDTSASDYVTPAQVIEAINMGRDIIITVPSVTVSELNLTMTNIKMTSVSTSDDAMVLLYALNQNVGFSLYGDIMYGWSQVVYTIFGTMSDINNLNTELNNKVDKVEGYYLSQNNYTTAEKNTLSRLVSGKEVGSLRTVGAQPEKDGYRLGFYSFAEGHLTKAGGFYSHAEGFQSSAVGSVSHAEGGNTKASNDFSHAEGNETIASGVASHAEGNHTIAASLNQHVQGRYNIEDMSWNYADIIGNGTQDQRSNAATVDWSGNAWYAGDVYVGSTSGTNKDDGSKKLATEEYVNNHTITVDSTLSLTSTNPVQNKVINTEITNLKTLIGDTSVSEQITAGIVNKVDKVEGMGLSTNDYTTNDKNKLSGIATGAEVNQNAFSNITIGNTTLFADAKTDTLTFEAGSNVVLTPDVDNDKITIDVDIISNDLIDIICAD